MKNKTYRDLATDGECFCDLESANDFDIFIDVDYVNEVFDDIENEVKSILDLLKPISGIETIDEAKEKLEKLSKQLY